LTESERLEPLTTSDSNELRNQGRVENDPRLLSAALACAANAVLITDRAGRITWVNPAFTELTGYSFDEVAGETPRILKSDTHDKAFYAELWSTILAGKVWKGEIVNRRKDATEYTELQTITPVASESGEITHFISIKEDVTERKALEEQFRQSQKMEAVGRLAGWVAHDFNNLLTAILGYTELLLVDAPPADPSREDLGAVKNAAERATALTRQLLAFGRRQALSPKILNLNRTVESLEKMLRRVIGEDVTLVTRLDPMLAATKADPGQLEQVLMNLAVNARDAMPDGGQLVIETKNVTLDDAYTNQRTVIHPGNYVMFSVSDTGVGLSKEEVERVFEPYFMTKGAREDKKVGSGLGLSTVYGIVKQSGGYIWAHSASGSGTTFKVYLPAAEGIEDSHAEDSYSFSRAGTETILLVEDEEDVRKLARRVLIESGYGVVEARNGAEALIAANEHEGRIELMLTDVIMPLMNGPEVARRQASLRPEMKVLFMSGYTDGSLSQKGLLEPGTELLQKPFPPSALLERVRKALDAEPGASASASVSA
jgi:PAS domain S-box-containing protein